MTKPANLMVYQKALYSGLPPDDNIGRGTGFPAGHVMGEREETHHDTHYHKRYALQLPL